MMLFTENQVQKRPILGWIVAALVPMFFASFLANSGRPPTLDTLYLYQLLFIVTVACLSKVIANRLRFPIGSSTNAITPWCFYGRRVAILMFAAGFGLIFGYMPVIDSLARFAVLPTLTVKVMLGVGFGLLFSGGGVWILARRISAPSAQVLLEQDQRPPILYLRAFQSDRRRIKWRVSWKPWKIPATFIRPHTIEGAIAPVLQEIGPVIAIGKPGELLAPLGAARQYTDEDWQARVLEDMERASIIVTTLGETAGVSWEVGEVLRRGYLHKFLFIVPSIRRSKRVALLNDIVARLESEGIIAGTSDPNFESVILGFIRRDGSLRLIQRPKRRDEDYASAIQQALSEITGRMAESNRQENSPQLMLDASRLQTPAHVSLRTPRLYLGSHAGIAAAVGGAIPGVALLAVTARRLGKTKDVLFLALFALLWDIGAFFMPYIFLPLYNVVSVVVVWTAGELLFDSLTKAKYETGAKRPWHATAFALGCLIMGLKYLIVIGVKALLVH